MTAAADPAFSFNAFILGAGRSARMGRPKLLLPWAGTNVISHLLNQWRAVGAQHVFVVFARDDELLSRELQRAKLPKSCWILNPAPEEGMFSSIRCAARDTAELPASTHCVVILGDQPHLRLSTLQGLIHFAAQNAGRICQPLYQGKARHPVVLPGEIFRALADSSASTFAEALKAHEIAHYVSPDPGLALDIDTPQDYQRALTLWGEGEDSSI